MLGYKWIENFTETQYIQTIKKLDETNCLDLIQCELQQWRNSK